MVWQFLRDRVRARFPRRPDQWLPDAPMRCHHYLYARSRYLTDLTILRQLGDAHGRSPPTKRDQSD